MLVGMPTGVATVENSMEYCFLRKLKMEMPFDPAIVLLGLYTKIPETPIQNNLCILMFIAAQLTVAKYGKQPKCPSANDWIKNLWYIYTMELYSGERKKELIPYCRGPASAGFRVPPKGGWHRRRTRGQTPSLMQENGQPFCGSN